MIVLTVFLIYAIVLSVALYLRGYRNPVQTEAAEPLKPPARLLVIGANGGTGSHIVMQALDRGYRVTAFVRNPSKLEMEHPNLNVVQGDVLEPDTLDEAAKGQDAVLSALGHSRFFYPTRILSQGTANILKAMQKHGVKRFICESSLGIGSSAGRLGLYYTFFTTPVILPFYYWDKARQESIVTQSDRDWVIVRPALLTNGCQKNSYRAGENVGNFILSRRISRADVAGFMLNQVESNGFAGKAPGLAY